MIQNGPHPQTGPGRPADKVGDDKIGDEDTGDAAENKPRQKRAPRKITRQHLENVALWYLTRFQASARSLEQVLLKRVSRSAHYHDSDPAVGNELVRELITRYREAGLLDDTAFACARARTLHDRGISTRGIKSRLFAKGVGPEEIEAALAALREDLDEDTDIDLKAAKRYAQRRRFGPWRRDDDLRAERREKDMAALARAGFSYHVAQAVIDADPDRDDGTD